MVSIIMTAYNDEKYIEETIKSILNQSYKEFEFLIYNDGSTDESLNIIKKYAKDDNRIKIYDDGKLGRAKALNLLVLKAKKKYIANIDSDDPAYKERIAEQIDYLEKNKKIALIGTGTELIDETGKKIGEIIPKTSTEELKKQMLIGMAFNHSSIMIRRKVLLEVGNYNSTLEAFIDYELWIRVLKKYKVSNLTEILSKKRIHNNQFFESGIIKKKYKKLTSYYFLAIKELKLSPRYYGVVMLRILHYYLPKNIKKLIKKIRVKEKIR